MIAWGKTNEFFNQLRTDANDEHQGHWAIHENFLSYQHRKVLYTLPHPETIHTQSDPLIVQQCLL